MKEEEDTTGKRIGDGTGRGKGRGEEGRRTETPSLTISLRTGQPYIVLLGGEMYDF